MTNGERNAGGVTTDEMELQEVVRILLVDDQPANLEALELTLASEDCQFVQARSANEALMALLEHDFAAVVLDIRMPGMSGLELAGLIKQRRRSQHVPILFLTAHMMDEKDVLEGYGAGAVDYLTKPIRPEILRSKIAVFADLYRKRGALARANDALQREVAERERAQEALRVVNQDLEVRVQERTAALRDADRRKDEFLASLAHELRNPLAALRTAAELFRLKAPPGSDLGMPQGVIDRQLKQMTRLIDDLLDVSRITRDRLTLRPERIELRKVVAHAVEASRIIIEHRGHDLVIDLPEEPIVLEADLARLAQVFSNLLDNAAKYTEPGGRITLRARTSGELVIVTVQDTGIGIDTAMLPKVFDLFTQAHETPPGRGYGGLGIGLTLVRRLIEMHGGTVTGHSEGTGKGSVFTITLPMQSATPAVAPAGTKSRPSGGTRKNLRVLVVEDNRDAAIVLSMMLDEWGHDNRLVHDAYAAIEQAAHFRPDVILLDLGLPQMHGFDVARRLRELPGGKHAVIAAVTGWGQEADRQQSKAAGIDHHLLKPVDPDALQALLAEVAAS